jgi:hypothetical protein
LIPDPRKAINLFSYNLEAISKMQITFKDKARAYEKEEHTREYVSILRRSATP